MKVDRVFANHYLSSTASLKELPTFPFISFMILLNYQIKVGILERKEAFDNQNMMKMPAIQ